MRITVYDILGWLASGMSWDDIVSEYPELTRDDIRAALEFVEAREHHTSAIKAA